MTFRARLYVDHEPGELEEDAPAHSELVVEHGTKPGQFLELYRLAAVMEEEIPPVLAARLLRDRDRYLGGLSAEEGRAVVERLAAVP